MTEKYDTNEPILILVRRGRKGRGFSVASVEDVSNAAPCSDEKEIGDVIKEMLDDVEQPRVNIHDLLAAAAGNPPGAVSQSDDEDEEEDEEEGDEDPHEGTIFEGVMGSGEGAGDRLLLNIVSGLVQKGKSMSTKRVRRHHRPRRKKKQ